MAVLKCGYCGGDLDFNSDMTIGICQFCGSTNTIPKNLEKKQNLYNKATYLRQNSEFDKAIETYDKLLDEDSMDADAHWGLVLSKYGIEYVTDPHSGERIPTCHRIQPELIINDLNYRAAIQYAKDIYTKDVYVREAEKIAYIQKKYLDVAKKETKYDVFVCYKETDDQTGERTLDSTLVQDIYYELEKKGYKVFFARKTLEGKLGTEYEPIIYAALMSARVMIVAGTKPEYFNAPWVRNEWSRYLQFAKEGDKVIIPVYRDMSPYNLPDELSVYQSLDMSKIGFLQDLIDGINKLTNKASKRTRSISGGVNIDALLMRGNMAIEDKQWESANKFFEQVLNMDAENVEAYKGLLYAEQHSGSIEQIGEKHLQETLNTKPQIQKVPIDEKTIINKAIAQYAIEGYYEAYKIEERYKFNLNYPSMYHIRESQYQKEEDFWDKNIIIKKIVRFGDENDKKIIEAQKELVLIEMKKRIDMARHEDAVHIEKITQDYQEHIKQTEQFVVSDYDMYSQRAENDREQEMLKKYEEIMNIYDYKPLDKENIGGIINGFSEIKNFYDNAQYCKEPPKMKLEKKLRHCERKIKFWKREPLLIFGLLIVCGLVSWIFGGLM